MAAPSASCSEMSRRSPEPPTAMPNARLSGRRILRYKRRCCTPLHHQHDKVIGARPAPPQPPLWGRTHNRADSLKAYRYAFTIFTPPSPRRRRRARDMNRCSRTSMQKKCGDGPCQTKWPSDAFYKTQRSGSGSGPTSPGKLSAAPSLVPSPWTMPASGSYRRLPLRRGLPFFGLACSSASGSGCATGARSRAASQAEEGQAAPQGQAAI